MKSWLDLLGDCMITRERRDSDRTNEEEKGIGVDMLRRSTLFICMKSRATRRNFPYTSSLGWLLLPSIPSRFSRGFFSSDLICSVKRFPPDSEICLYIASPQTIW